MLVLRALVGGALRLGISPADLAGRADIAPEWLTPELLTDPDARVPDFVVRRLWEYLPAESGEESFGMWLAEQVEGAPLSIAWWLVLSYDG